MNSGIAMLFFVAAGGLIAIGIAGLLLSRNLFRMVLALAVAEAGANLLLILAGYRWDAAAPILLDGKVVDMVDPVPQAMVLTAIVIGVGVQALALTLVIRIKQRYGTLDMSEARQRMLDELDAEAGVSGTSSREGPAGERPLPAPNPIQGSQAIQEVAGE